LLDVLEEGYFNAPSALAAGLVDTLIHYDEIDEFIEELGTGKCHRVGLWSYGSEGHIPVEWRTDRPKVALLAVEGTLAPGESFVNPVPIPFIGGKFAGSETLIQALRHARTDRSIRAVVLRVNSSGGISLASELLSREVEITAREKPVVISMSSVAASGGYDLSSFGTRLMADESSLTGSIGVWAGKPVLRGLFEKLGLSTDILKIGPHADVFSPDRPFDERERQKLESEVQWAYDRFVSRVAEGRGMSVDSVDALAQGRIWSGRAACNIGLVDSCGGVLDAVRWAKSLSGLEPDCEVEIVQLPGTGMGSPLLFGQGRRMDLRFPLLEAGLLYILPYSFELD
jgi:protease-4